MSVLTVKYYYSRVVTLKCDRILFRRSLFRFSNTSKKRERESTKKRKKKKKSSSSSSRKGKKKNPQDEDSEDTKKEGSVVKLPPCSPKNQKEKDEVDTDSNLPWSSQKIGQLTRELTGGGVSS